MPKVIADISMSLDGYVTGPHPDLEHGLGRGGEPLHTWAVDSDDPVDLDVLRQSTDGTGAVVMGRRLFEVVDGPHGWSATMGYGANLAGSPPFFVITHSVPTAVRLDLHFTFCTDGLTAGIDQARSAAGSKDVVIMGGGNVVRQSVVEGLADELRLHLSPVILGAGTPLFGDGDHRQLAQTGARISATATHVTYRVRP